MDYQTFMKSMEERAFGRFKTTVEPREKPMSKIDLDFQEKTHHFKTSEEEVEKLFEDRVDTLHNFRFYFDCSNPGNLKNTPLGCQKVQDK